MGSANSSRRGARITSEGAASSTRNMSLLCHRRGGPMSLAEMLYGVSVDQGPVVDPHRRRLSLSTSTPPSINVPHSPLPSHTSSAGPNSIDRIPQGDWVYCSTAPVHLSVSRSEGCPDLTEKVHRLSFVLVYDGPYSRVYRGRRGEQQVAIKAIKCLAYDTLHATRRRCRRERGASRFDHPNILHIYGIIEADWCAYGCIVTPWCQNGDAFAYVRRENLGRSDAYQLLCGVAAGLEYLHVLLVVHGDIKPGNILIDDVGNPLITDFGLMCHLDPERPNDVIDNTTTPHLGTIRYLAYELVEPDPPEPRSMASDIHALGCVCYALIYLMEPYAWRLDNKSGHLFRDIAKGIPPASRPEASLEPPLPALWDLMEGCWDQEPIRRLVIEVVRAKLKILAEQEL